MLYAKEPSVSSISCHMYYVHWCLCQRTEWRYCMPCMPVYKWYMCKHWQVSKVHLSKSATNKIALGATSWMFAHEKLSPAQDFFVHIILSISSESVGDKGLGNVKHMCSSTEVSLIWTHCDKELGDLFYHSWVTQNFRHRANTLLRFSMFFKFMDTFKIMR